MIAYAIIGGVGFLLLLLTFIIGELADSIGSLFEQDIDVDVAGHDVIDIGGDSELRTGPAFFSIRILASFITGFGVVGALVMGQGWSAMAASIPALGTGVFMSVAIYLFSVLLYRQQATSGYNPREVTGRSAEVTTSIPSDGLGEVSLVVGGQYEHFAARSSDNQAIKSGTRVTIMDLSGSIAVVRQS